MIQNTDSNTAYGKIVMIDNVIYTYKWRLRQSRLLTFALHIIICTVVEHHQSESITIASSSSSNPLNSDPESLSSSMTSIGAATLPPIRSFLPVDSLDPPPRDAQ
jgi:hypothetical protein